MTGIQRLIKVLEKNEFSSDFFAFKRYITNKQGTQLLIEDVFSSGQGSGSEWIDASEWDMKQLVDWLGY
jgi:hypothetical protein